MLLSNERHSGSNSVRSRQLHRLEFTSSAGSLPSSAIEKAVVNFDREVIGMILMLPVASKTDSGTYKCNVHNQIGSDSRTFQVAIS